MDDRQETLRSRLFALGFDSVRMARLRDLPGARLQSWLDEGMHGDMAWMERSVDKRLHPGLVLPGAQSIIMLGVNYWPGELAQPGAQWARYALYEDYHDTMKPAMIQAGEVLAELYQLTSMDYRYYIDTGPVIERGWAASAGLGFVGKNAMLISRQHGNWLFLASILVRAELIADPPVRTQISDFADVGLLCGKCTRCLDACPTQAFSAPGIVDARRCISYQTIENKGIIPRELRAGIGQHIYGCDVCLEVCPWNRFAQQGRELLLTARFDLPELGLHDLLTLTPERFAEIFRRTPIKRLKLPRLLRNACVVAGNGGDESLLPVLVDLTGHDLALVRAHAVWAVQRLGGADQLLAQRAAERDPDVLAEYAWADAETAQC